MESGRTDPPHEADASCGKHAVSFIRTVTVGPGIAPDLLTLPEGRRSRAEDRGPSPPVGNFTPP